MKDKQETIRKYFIDKQWRIGTHISFIISEIKYEYEKDKEIPSVAMWLRNRITDPDYENDFLIRDWFINKVKDYFDVEIYYVYIRPDLQWKG